MKLKLISFFALTATLGLAACQESPTAVGDISQSHHQTINGVTLLSLPASARLQPASQVEEWFSPAGGTIEVDGGRLTVPAGALILPVQITMKSRVDDRYQYKFGPNGLQFNVPATLTIAVDPLQVGIDPEHLAIAVASDAGDDWEIVGGTYDPITGTVSAEVHHFTQYALCQN